MAGVKCVMFLVVVNFLSLSKGDDVVSCIYMESCILPCSFQAGDGAVILWVNTTAEDTEETIHSYYNNTDQLTLQDQRFKGRTSLFRDQISRGNASLHLTGVEVQDQGRYKCYTSTDSGNKESFIILKVDEPEQDGSGSYWEPIKGVLFIAGEFWKKVVVLSRSGMTERCAVNFDQAIHTKSVVTASTEQEDDETFYGQRENRPKTNIGQTLMKVYPCNIERGKKTEDMILALPRLNDEIHLELTSLLQLNEECSSLQTSSSDPCLNRRDSGSAPNSHSGCKFLSVAHVIDEGIEFITPHKITETHVIINITGFSGFGNVKDEDSPPDPVQALVLLFYRPLTDPESVLSVLLLPKNIVMRDVLRKRKEYTGDERYIETSPHCKLIPKQEYTLSTSPEDDSVLVQPKKAKFYEELDRNYFPSFQVNLETTMRNIKLFLRDTNSSDSVWERRVCLLSTGVRKPTRQSARSLSSNERLKYIRTGFIERISGPVLQSLLDNLFDKDVITESERESADDMQNKRDKARFVIDTIQIHIKTAAGKESKENMSIYIIGVVVFICLGLVGMLYEYYKKNEWRVHRTIMIGQCYVICLLIGVVVYLTNKLEDPRVKVDER
ncbi:NACHT%2C LRR and PYD domains-containing protein 1b allele 3-like [Scomber scombrus]|uniref:NACHT, LRR and PYD domains-containing protein 1b allele 3-like n=1 Tax=Scomber scombrus TaxID=13677 RepID=A0AAV1PG52_SCOSC